jgi:hypothetical protein
MRRWIRFTATSLALASLALATPALADQGHSVVDSKSVAESLVVLGGTTYRVSDSTAIEDSDGNAIPLADVPAIAQGAGQDDAAVFFESSEGNVTMPVLHRLKLTGAVPQ